MAKKGIILGKDELVGKIAEAAGESKASTNKVVTAYPQVVAQILVQNQPKKVDELSDSIPLPGFGSIAVKKVGAVTRKNNLNGSGEEYTVPEHLVPTIKLSQGFKVALNADVLEKAAKDKKAASEKPAKSA